MYILLEIYNVFYGVDIVERVGKLELLEMIKTANGGAKYKCLCDCGNIVYKRKSVLDRAGDRTTCGHCYDNAAELIGQKYGKLTILEYTKSRGAGGRFKCQCECGNIAHFEKMQVLSGNNKSCGCLNSTNLVGQRFNKLVVLSHFMKNRSSWSQCQCDCGKIALVSSAHLLTNHTKSCGCMNHLPVRRLRACGEVSTKKVLITYKSNARLRGFDFGLSDEMAIELFSGDCYYCGAPPSRISMATNTNGKFIYSGIDRLNSNIGYVPDNCVSCCTQCNVMKMKMSEEEFITKADKITKHQLSKVNFEESLQYLP